MKSVICVYDGTELGLGRRLTIGKIYEVLEMPSCDIIFIKDDVGNEVSYVMKAPSLEEDDVKVWFEDAKPYIIEEKLNKLGI